MRREIDLDPRVVLGAEAGVSSSEPGKRSFLDRYLAVLPFAIAALALLSLLLWEASITADAVDLHRRVRVDADLSRDRGHRPRRPARRADRLQVAVRVPDRPVLVDRTPSSAAYAAIKYANTIVMALAAIPTYLLARMMVSRRAAAIAGLAVLCTSAFFYAGFLLPEVLAYPTFALCAWVSIRALAGGGRWWIAGAIVLNVLATQVRSELVTLPAAFALSAAVLWVVGPRGQRLRRGWSVLDHIAAALVLVAVLLVLNRILGPHASQWHTVTTSWRGRMWSLGMQATEALALGLGLFPLVCGLASLWIPERRHDPYWRAFAAFTAAAIVTVWTYTAVKAAYLSTVFATRVEERNLIYLGPLLLVGTVVWLCSHRRWLPGTLAAWAFTTWLVLYYGYQLDYPYFEAPGYGIATLANRSWHWDQPTIRIGLAVASGVLLLVLLVMHAPRVHPRARTAIIVLAAAVVVTWMLAGEITSANGSASGSKAYADGLAKPLDWVDRATGRAPTTFIGQNISSGDALGIDMLEFWNRSLKNIWSLDGSAPGPGGTLTPDLANRYGKLTSDPGFDYALTTNDVDLVGQVVARRPGLTLRRIVHHPWALRQSVYGVSQRRLDLRAGGDGRGRGPLRLLRPGAHAGNADGGGQPQGVLLVDRPARPRRGARRPGRARSTTRTGRRPRSADRALRAAELLAEGDQPDRHSTGRGAGHRLPDVQPARLRARRQPASRRAGRLRVQTEPLTAARNRSAQPQPLGMLAHEADDAGPVPERAPRQPAACRSRPCARGGRPPPARTSAPSRRCIAR